MAEFGPSSLKRAWYYLQKNGIKDTWTAVRERLEDGGRTSYSYTPPAPEALSAQKKEPVSALQISVVVPVFETPADHLEALLESLSVQTYPHWEVVLADGSSTERAGRAVEAFAKAHGLPFERLREQAEETPDAGGWQDRCIRYLKLAQNGGISQNTNAGIAHVRGSWTGFLDHDDLLTPDALYEMAAAYEREKEAGRSLQAMYSDEDKCDGQGRRFYEPHLKCDFNLDLLLSNNYICHFLVMESALLQKLRLRPEYDGAQDYDLVLRAVAAGARFVHVDRVLYHWRCHTSSTAQNPKSKAYAYEAGRRAVESFCRQAGWKVSVSPLKHLGYYRVDYENGPFFSRPEVGAWAGPLPDRKRLRSGIYEEDGSQRYAGLKKGFSGPLHRAALQQEVETADIRCMMASPRFQEQLQAAGRQALEPMPTETQEEAYARVSRAFCRQVRKAGCRIVWDPQFGGTWEKGWDQTDGTEFEDDGGHSQL